MRENESKQVIYPGISPFGLYHAPRVATDLLVQRREFAGLMNHQAPCVCGNPAHIYEARPEGWCNVAWDAR